MARSACAARAMFGCATRDVLVHVDRSSEFGRPMHVHIASPYPRGTLTSAVKSAAHPFLLTTCTIMHESAFEHVSNVEISRVEWAKPRRRRRRSCHRRPYIAGGSATNVSDIPQRQHLHPHQPFFHPLFPSSRPSLQHTLSSALRPPTRPLYTRCPSPRSRTNPPSPSPSSTPTSRTRRSPTSNTVSRTLPRARGHGTTRTDHGTWGRAMIGLLIWWRNGGRLTGESRRGRGQRGGSRRRRVGEEARSASGVVRWRVNGRRDIRGPGPSECSMADAILENEEAADYSSGILDGHS